MVLILILTTVKLHAQERKYVVGTTTDFVVGGSSGQNVVGARPADASAGPGSFFYEVYPTIQMHSPGAHSTFEASYAFGLSRVNSDLNYDSNSHVVSARLSGSLSPKWKYSLSESFQMTSNFATFNTTRSVASSPEGFRFLFNPAAFNQSSHTNTALVTAEYALNKKSTLSLIGSHYLLNYPQQDALFRGGLSDQQRAAESITYSQRTTERIAWSVTYTGTYLHFEQFESARSHALSAGYSHQIAPNLTLQVKAGPTYVQTAGSAESYTSYNTQVTVQKVIKTNTLAFYYGHDSGEPSGLGSISDNDRAGFSMSRLIGGNASVFVDVSAFDVRGRLGNPYSTRGTSVAANVGVPLTRALSVHCGGQYQHYDQTLSVAFEQKRIYVSLRLNAPELWKLSK